MCNRRYSRNIEALSAEDTALLHTKSICVAGCGGLGGYIAEILARIGVLSLTLIDCDVFDETNLNRQLFCTERALGLAKTEAARARVAEVNSDVSVRSVYEKITEENALRILSGHDLVMDALDDARTRLLLAKTCRELDIPLVHGAIGGWYGQIANVLPGDGILEALYPEGARKGVEDRLGNLPFTAAAVAALQCAEAVKLLTGKGEPLKDRVLRVDLLNNDYDIISVK